jgi:ADP-ribose pyrophosphatase YjhB (NUDIX family)
VLGTSASLYNDGTGVSSVQQERETANRRWHMSHKKHAHCSYCGTRFADGQTWPRTCAGCGNISYLNPLPVAVLLQPVGDALLGVRRAIEPALGKIALPGGFIDKHETWQQAAARELAEEVGLTVNPASIRLFDAQSSDRGDGILLIFGLALPLVPAALPAFTPNEEVSEVVLLHEPQELAFPLHTQAMRDYFRRNRPG